MRKKRNISVLRPSQPAAKSQMPKGLEIYEFQIKVVGVSSSLRVSRCESEAEISSTLAAYVQHSASVLCSPWQASDQVLLTFRIEHTPTPHWTH